MDVHAILSTVLLLSPNKHAQLSNPVFSLVRVYQSGVQFVVQTLLNGYGIGSKAVQLFQNIKITALRCIIHCFPRI
jgi:hypothetical protein